MYVLDNTFYEEIRIKHGFCCISLCSLRILYNSKFILMAISLGTNAVIVTRVHCTSEQSDQDFCFSNYRLQDTIHYIDEQDNPHQTTDDSLGPVVQSVVSLRSLLRVISLTVLADSIYNILIFFAEKM